jgi:hypothetical protein
LFIELEKYFKSTFENIDISIDQATLERHNSQKIIREVKDLFSLFERYLFTDQLDLDFFGYDYEEN